MIIGIISDIHEDKVRLNEALDILMKKKCDEIVCLGDIAGFSVPNFAYLDTRDASYCINTVKENCKHIVAGNHDLYAAKKIPQHKAGFNYPETWYQLDYKQRRKLSKGKLWLYEDKELSPLINNSEVKFLEQLPEYKIVEYNGINIMFSHYLYPDLTGSLVELPEKHEDFEKHLEFMQKNDVLIGFIGHGHMEGIAYAKSKKLKFKPFGKYKIKRKPQIIASPCIANGKKANGLMVFNTEKPSLDVIPLKSKKLKFS